MFGTHRPQHDVDEVHAPIGHEAAGVIPEPTEVEMETVFVEGAFWRRAEPQIVIDTSGRLAVRRIADAGDPIEVNPAANETDFAEFAGMDEIDGVFEMRAAAPLRSHLHDTIVAL